MNMIQSWWNALVGTIASPYLRWFWYCFFGYLAVWALAAFLARLGGKEGSTIIYRCRQSLAIALLLHALATLSVTTLWWKEYFPFRGFYGFLMVYLCLLVTDAVVICKLIANLSNYRTFNR